MNNATTTYASSVATRQEHVILIARVSSGKQREEDQVPGLTAYAVRKGYIIDAVVPIHGRTAFHGKHVKAVLAAVDEHVKRGTATVVIFRHADRAQRQGPFEGYDLVKKIMDAGARVEFSMQEFLNDQPGLLGMFFQMGFEESKGKSDRKIQGIEVRAAAGKLNGKPPWGYSTVEGVLTPNTLGAEWIPKIYNGVIAGRGIRSIADELKDHGVTSPNAKGVWGSSTIIRLIHNPTYKGDRVGKGAMEYQALVSPDVWAQANAAISEGHQRGRGTTVNTKALLAPVCGECFDTVREGCTTGKSIMHRGGRYTIYYRCAGAGPGRKGCGASTVPMAELDGLVEWIVSRDVTPHTTTVYHPAVDSSEAIKEISKRIRKADADGNDELMEELVSERKGLRLLGTIIPAWKEEKSSGMTRAEYYATLGPDDRREMLAKVPWVARKRNGVTAVRIAMEDGSEHWIDQTMMV